MPPCCALPSGEFHCATPFFALHEATAATNKNILTIQTPCAAAPTPSTATSSSSSSPLSTYAVSSSLLVPPCVWRGLTSALDSDIAMQHHMADSTREYAAAHGINVHTYDTAMTAADGSSGSSSSSSSSSSSALVPSLLPAPVTLLPVSLPRSAFEQMHKLVFDFNHIYDQIARDTNFMRATLAPAALEDDFLRHLLFALDESDRVRSWPKQTLQLAINRSDYIMQHEDTTTTNTTRPEENEIKEHSTTSASSPTSRLVPLQVEFNTISAGAGSLSQKVSELHRHTLDRYMRLRGLAPSSFSSSSSSCFTLPPNPVLRGLASAMCRAHCAFMEDEGITHTDANTIDANTSNKPDEAERAMMARSAVILFVVQPRERNVTDQRLIEYELFESYGIPVVRLTLSDLLSGTHLDAAGRLWLRPSSLTGDRSQLVSLVYFRAGYTPNDFPTEQEWDALIRIESSRAIKCPSVAYHLAGCKKIQQVLNSRDVLQRFCRPVESSHDSNDNKSPSIPTQSDRILRVYTHLLPIDSTSRRLIASEPSEWVLKPQREGGGNNLWGAQMIKELNSKTDEQMRGYIAMRRIRPNKRDATPPCATGVGVSSSTRFALKFGRLVPFVSPLSEIGLMGSRLSRLRPCASSVGPVELDVLSDEYIGYLVRTKEEALNEGGLMTGVAAIDTIIIQPEEQ